SILLKTQQAENLLTLMKVIMNLSAIMFLLISEREMQKIALGLNLPAVAFKTFHDVYIEGVEKEKLNSNGPLFKKIKRKIIINNLLSDQSVLFIYADAPSDHATQEQLAKISEVRSIIRERMWCKEVHIVESEKNKGLANSIIEGVSDVVNRYGKVIVLEDDIV